MSEINVVEQRYTPERPKVVAHEAIDVYVPVAGYKYPGIASFDPYSFYVNTDGKVSSRRKGIRGIIDIIYNKDNGTFLILYDDGTNKEFSFPVITNDKYVRHSLFTIVEFSADSFIQVEDVTGKTVWALYLPPLVTGFNNDKFLASVELSSGDIPLPDYQDNAYFVTSVDSQYKGSDGSFIIYSEYTREELERVYGRIILFGGAIYTDEQIVSINYEKGVLTLTHAEQNEQGIHKQTSINIADKSYVENEINERLSSVYYPQGNITAEEFSTIIPSEQNYGYLWILTDEILTDERFVEGSYESLSPGTQILVVKRDGKYYFNAMRWFLDLSKYATLQYVNNVESYIISNFIKTAYPVENNSYTVEGTIWADYLGAMSIELTATKIDALGIHPMNFDDGEYYDLLFPRGVNGTLLTEEKAEEKFVQIVDTPTSRPVVYAKNTDENDITIPVSYFNENVVNTIPRYAEKGTLRVGTPTSDEYAANKKYVDDKFKNYRLIRDITLEEDVQQIDINTDDSGNPLNLKGVFITFFGKFTGETGERSLKLAYNGGLVYQMYRATNLTQYYLDNAVLQWIKSERMNLPDRNIFVSQFSLVGVPNSGTSYNAIQGLSDMNTNMQCDYAESAPAGVKTINRIQYGQVNTAKGLMAAGGRIFIWGIDDDE